MAEEPTIHDVLTGTLAHRAEALGEVVPTSLDGVARRVERRRARRRMTAVGGSLAVLAAGGVGLLLLPGGGSEPAPGAGSTGAAAPGTEVVDGAGLWRCTGLVGSDGTASYFDACEQLPDGAQVTLTPDAQAPAVTTASPQAEQTYTVQAGDSIFSIAEQYGVDMQVLANYNRWEDGLDHVLDVGDVVRIPPGPAAPTTTTSG